MSDFEFRGADEFGRLSKALKQAGATDLRKELHGAMKRAGTPLVKVAKDASADAFPKRGGLSRRERKIPFRAQVRTGRNPGLRIVAPGKYVVGKTTNATGRFRHPVFADNSKTRRDWTWHDQNLGNQGWFDHAMEGSAPTVLPELEQAINDTVEKIVRGKR